MISKKGIWFISFLILTGISNNYAFGDDSQAQSGTCADKYGTTQNGICFNAFGDPYNETESGVCVDVYGNPFNCGEPYYQETGFRLYHDPTICATTPNDQDFPNLAQKTLGFTQESVNEWQNQLGKPFVLHYVTVPLNQIGIFEYKKCDIVINYEPQPSVNQTIPNSEPIGITNYDLYNHRAQITIFYKLVDWSSGSQEVQCSWGGDSRYDLSLCIATSVTPYYTNYLASDSQLEYAIRHELGHAFGLGHFIADINSFANYTSVYQCHWNDNMFCLGTIVENLPSLMMPSVGPIPYDESNNIHVKIQDVTQIKQYLYGNDGFNSPIFPLNDASNLQPQTMPPIQNSSVPANVTMSKIPSWVKNNAGWWSQGLVGNDDFIKGIQYLIQQGIIQIPSIQSNSNPSQTIPSWVKNNAGWWANGQVSDDEFIKGMQYLVSNGIIKLS